jgi:hypothetical protein
MTDQQTEQTETQPAVFPDRAIREAFPDFADQKTIQQAWSAMTPQDQGRFVTEVQDGDPEGLAGRVAAFLGTPGTADGGTGEQNGGDEQSDGDEIAEALRTGETAEAYAKDNPDRIGDLLDAERAGKARKTVIEELERAQRVHDREQGKTPETPEP